MPAPLLSRRLLPLLVLTVSAWAVVLLCRIFPAQDGPIHLYYAEVTRNLLLGTGPYGDWYVIGHHFPPYALQVYVLMAFNSLFDPLVSEKLLVCLYLTLFLFGFRYLVQSVNPDDELAPLAGAPFAFSLFLYAGSYNYVLGLAIDLWAAGFWMRHANSEFSAKRAMQFLALIVLLTVTHPIALASLLLFCGLHLVVMFASVRATSMKDRIGATLRPAAVLAIASLSMLYILRFITNDSQVKVSAGDARQRILDCVMMWTVSPVRSRPYRYYLLALLVAAGLAALAGLWRSHSGQVKAALSPTLFVAGAVSMVLTFLSPARVSGGTNISSRLWVFGVLMIMAAGAIAPLRQQFRQAAAAALFLSTLASFVVLYRMDVRLNEESRVYLETPVAPAGSQLYWITDYVKTEEQYSHSPHYWQACYYALRSKAIFANYGFLYVPYMNLRPKNWGKCTGLDPTVLPDRPAMGTCLMDSRNDQDRPKIDVLLSTLPEGDAIAAAYGLQPMQQKAGAVAFYAKPK